MGSVDRKVLILMESKKRSFFKAISWRITATVTTTVISYFITGQIATALKIGVIEVVAKMALYYFHERAWANSSFGLTKAKSSDYQI